MWQQKFGFFCVPVKICINTIAFKCSINALRLDETLVCQQLHRLALYFYPDGDESNHLRHLKGVSDEMTMNYPPPPFASCDSKDHF